MCASCIVGQKNGDYRLATEYAISTIGLSPDIIRSDPFQLSVAEELRSVLYHYRMRAGYFPDPPTMAELHKNVFFDLSQRKRFTTR